MSIEEEPLGEFQRIARLHELLKNKLPPGVLGIGDDCAVVPLGLFAGSDKACLLQTTDAMVEGVHFRLDFTSAYELGRKLLSVSLSDIAAMGGRGVFAVVTLQLRRDLAVEIVEEIYQGLDSLAREQEVMLLGGDTVSGKELSLGLTLTGKVDGAPVLRSGANAGDDIWVSGEIGAGVAGLLLLKNKVKRNLFSNSGETVLRRYRNPEARSALGQQLLQGKIATAAIDVSDGLLQDLGHILAQSGVAAEVVIESIPLPEGFLDSGIKRVAALTGGDDYELLFTAPSAKRTAVEALSNSTSLPKLTRIGRIRSIAEQTDTLVLVRDDGRALEMSRYFAEQGWKGGAGYDHVRARRGKRL